MKIKYILLNAFIVCLSVACGSKYSKVKIKDANAGDTYIYGDIDGKAKQLKNTYASATPETIEKANKFRALIESELVSGK